jgi:primosomal protein N' (replication factor Y)
MTLYANIILTIPEEEGFTYRIPQELTGYIQPGIQVIIPFRKKYISGIVLETTSKLPEYLAEAKIKSIQDIVSTTPILTPELMTLLKWISEYYICHLGQAYRLIQSQINVGKSQVMLRRCQEVLPADLTSDQQKILEQIPHQQEISLKTIRRKLPLSSLNSLITQLEKSGYLEKTYSQVSKKSHFTTEDFFQLNLKNKPVLDKISEREVSSKNRRLKANQLIEFLRTKEWVSYSELKTAGFTRQLLERKVQDQFLLKKTEVQDHLITSAYQETFSEISLTVEQKEVIAEVKKSMQSRKFETYLVHGITGSGKTQIYIELIHATLLQGQQAIVLIPEIVLTPQTLARFQHYFGEQVAVIHSRLLPSQKREILFKIRQGHYKVVLGPRSAIFAPVQNLGLIVVDEEHESSYKQSDAQPHYHARDVAIYRAKLNQAVVVLGSATPSFETLYNVRQGTYRYFRLGKRIAARALPRISLVDLREEWKKIGENPIISENMELKIESRLLTKEQLMILQNRRGYAPYIICKDCGYVAKCPHCEITLTFHQYNHRLLCHYCGFSQKAPDVCPSCQGMDILYKGIGTQKIEEVLLAKFANIRVIRMDQDTTRGRYAHQELLEKFRSGAADVLLGTKMIAKGLDFKKVTLVGVVSADQGLHFPDFRASEKVFQLLTQAAGRAGRGSSSGEVVIQTIDPLHIIFKFLLTHDYLSFYDREILSRKTLRYPPYSRLILIRLEGEDQGEIVKYGESIVQFLWRANIHKAYSVLGPAPSPIVKIRNIYRYQILIKQDKEKDSSSAYLRKIVKEGLLKKPEVKKWPLKMTIDVDPIEIL